MVQSPMATYAMVRFQYCLWCWLTKRRGQRERERERERESEPESKPENNPESVRERERIFVMRSHRRR